MSQAAKKPRRAATASASRKPRSQQHHRSDYSKDRLELGSARNPSGGCKNKPSHDDKIKKILLAMHPIDVLPDASNKTSSNDSQDSDGNAVHTDVWDASCSYADVAAFDPGAGVLFPGALVRGDSLNSGLLALAGLEQAPIRVNITSVKVLASSFTAEGIANSLAGGATGFAPSPIGNVELEASARPAPTFSASICEPSWSASEDARQKLLSSVSAGGSIISFERYQFYSFHDLCMRISASASGTGFSFQAQYNDTELSTNTNLVIKFVEKQYTYTVDPPQNAGLDLLSEHVTANQVLTVSNISSGATANPLTYVANVVYGRVAYLTLSSSATASDVNAAINAAVDFLSGGGSASLTLEQKQLISQSDTKLFIMGGDGKLALAAAAGDPLTGLMQYIQNGGGNIANAVPISYRINYLNNNTVARISFASNYSLVKKTPLPRMSGASIAFHTTDQSKDGDTDVAVSIVRRGGGPIVAFWRLGHEQEFPNGSDNGPFSLSVNGLILASDFGGYDVVMNIAPNGSNTWHFSAYVVVQASDGRSGSHVYPGISLSDDNTGADLGGIPTV